MENSNLECTEAERLSSSLDSGNNCFSTSNKQCIEAERFSNALDPDENFLPNKESIEAETLSSGPDPGNNLVSNNDASMAIKKEKDLEVEMFRLEVGDETFSKIMKPLDDLLEEINGVNICDEVKDNTVDSEESNLEKTEQQNQAGVDNILDTITRGRVCGKWYSSKANYYGSINPELQVDWVSKCGLLFAYSAALEHVFEVNDIDREEMISLYIADKGRHEIIINKMNEAEADLKQWEIQYRKKFKRKTACKSEHNTPFCKYCGWPDHWVKSFNKRGIHIKEAMHWSDKNVWYSNTKEMNAILKPSTSSTN